MLLGQKACTVCTALWLILTLSQQPVRSLCNGFQSLSQAAGAAMSRTAWYTALPWRRLGETDSPD
jgi:hypothetical protein